MKPRTCSSAFAVLLALMAVQSSHAAGQDEVAGNSTSEAVSKVITLLTELKDRVNHDSTQEQEVFDKYACWCEETTQKKAAVITKARDQLTALGTTILELKGSVATTVSEISQLIEDIHENEEAQRTATAVRQKQNAAFEAERQELQEAINALEQAVHVLKEATAASLLGKGRKLGTSRSGVAEAAAAAVEAAQAAASRLPSQVARQAADRQLVALTSSARSAQTYAPQSATIQGILGDMYNSFASTLESRTNEEHTNQRTYEDLMHSYQTSLLTLQGTLAKKEQAKAEAETMLADATQSYDDTEAQLKVDVEFFDTTKASCVAKADEWSTRKALRADELAGIEQALEILSSDDARELFGKAITPGIGTFLQVEATPSKKQRNSRSEIAFRKLREGARRSKSLRLAALAASLGDASGMEQRGVGHFDQVLKAIDTLIDTLKDEEATDDSRAANCKEQIHNIALTSEDLDWKIKENIAKIDKLEQVVAAKNVALNATEEELVAMGKDISDMKAQRIDANQKYLAAKNDDLQAIELLQQAKGALMAYYTKQGHDISLMQQAPNDTAPEASFSKDGSRKLESKGIVQLLDTIIEDVQAEIAQGLKEEEADQLDYEKRLAAAEAVVEELNEKKVNLEGTIATTNQQKNEESEAKSDNELALDAEKQEEEDLKPSCDWIAANIEERRRKRALELDALGEAKAYLADMNQPAVLIEIRERSRNARHALRGAP